MSYAADTEVPVERTRAQIERFLQAARGRWRAILLILKAKFEAVEAGISTFESEFLADTVMANGHTVGAWIAPQLETMYGTGRMAALLPAAEAGDRRGD